MIRFLEKLNVEINYRRRLSVKKKRVLQKVSETAWERNQGAKKTGWAYTNSSILMGIAATSCFMFSLPWLGLIFFIGTMAYLMIALEVILSGNSEINISFMDEESRNINGLTILIIGTILMLAIPFLMGSGTTTSQQLEFIYLAGFGLMSTGLALVSCPWETD